MPLNDQRYIGQVRPEVSRLHLDRDLYWVVPFGAPLLLAVVGKRFVGVSQVINYLRERHGFRTYTLGGELRRLAEERGVPVQHRRYLQDFGDAIRTERQDPAYLSRLILRRIRSDSISAPSWQVPRNIAIGGLKLVAELEVLEKVHGFRAIEVRSEDDKVRYRRVILSGHLAEEYEADRARREAAKFREKRLPSWAKAEKRAYFDALDEDHENGHPSAFPEEYKGKPAEVIAKLAQPLVLNNDGTRVDQLHAAVDEMLTKVRPRAQIVHH